MIILLDLKNYKQIASLVTHVVGPAEIRLSKTPPRFEDALPYLKRAADGLISGGISFSLYDMPYCLMLGYKRYITFSSATFKKSAACKQCSYRRQCKGVLGSYHAQHGFGSIHAVGLQTYSTDLERCMLKILAVENKIATDRVLELTKRFSICKGCSSGAHVVITGEKLVKKGMVKKQFKKGVYIWSLADGGV